MEMSKDEASTLSELAEANTSVSTQPKLNQVESHLESLGFVINNGEARFKLGESVTVNHNDGNTDFIMVDKDDTLSFVVLGKNSLDSIQALSMASYMDIQQKSMSVDYNSMISSISSDDVHNKLTELLQENTKLKETLRQNNSSMKQQISVLAVWQEETMKVLQNQKKKFAETTQLIKYLKKENNELKMRLSMENTDDIEVQYNVVHPIGQDPEMQAQNLNMSNQKEKTLIVMNECNISMKKSGNSSVTNTPSNVIDLKLENVLNESVCTLSGHESNTLKSSTFESAVGQNCSPNLSQSSVCEQITENCELQCKDCAKRDHEITALKKSIFLLEEKLKEATAPIQCCAKHHANVEEYKQCIENMKFYVDKFQTVVNLFDTQIECVSKTETYIDDLLDKRYVEGSEMNCQEFEAWSTYYTKMTEGKLKLKKNRTEAAKCQQMINEWKTKIANSYLTNSGEPAKSMPQIAQSITNESNLIEKEKQKFEQEKENLRKAEILFKKVKKELDEQYKQLNETMELLEVEKISLNEERMSLNQQSQLYENFVTALQIERRELEIKCDQLTDQTGVLKTIVETKDEEIKELQKRIIQYEETISVLEVQMAVYKEDFLRERRIKERLLENVQEGD